MKNVLFGLAVGVVVGYVLRLICKTVEFVLQTFELSLIFHPAK